MTRRRYTAEFKKEAARMILIDGTPVREVSEQLGVPEGVLYNWKAKHLDELEALKPDGAASPKTLAAENAELRKELAKARRMNEILKKRWATSARKTNAVSLHKR
jgi:transposase